MGELSAAETLFSSIWMFSRSVSKSSTYTSTKTQIYFDYVDGGYIIVAQILRILECLQTCCSELMMLAFSCENRSSMA